MNAYDWPHDEASPPRTELRRSLVSGGLVHDVSVAAVDGRPTAVRLEITDGEGEVVGRLAGEVPVTSLAAIADLLPAALSAAAAAHGATVPVRRPSKTERKRQHHPNHGTKWTEAEEEALAERFRNGATVAELSRELGRNENSIRARLVQLELLPAEEWPAAVPDRPSRSPAA